MHHVGFRLNREADERLGRTGRSLTTGRSLRRPIRDDGVDVIFTSEVIQHLLPAQSEALLAIFVRRRKPGGRVLLKTPNGLKYRRLRQECVLSLRLRAAGDGRSDLLARERLKARSP